MTPERFIARAAGLRDYADGRTYALTTLTRLIAVGRDLGTAMPLAIGAMVVLRDDLRKLCDDDQDGRYGSLRMTALHGAFDARENRERRVALLSEVDAWVSDNNNPRGQARHEPRRTNDHGREDNGEENFQGDTPYAGAQGKTR